MEHIVGLLNAIAWPIVALVVLLVFRSSIVSLFQNIRSLEGPGDFKAIWKEEDVKKAIEHGEQNKESAEIIAQRIMQIIDKRETRILRALLDDSDRKIYNYQSTYYKDSLDSLIEKGYVVKHGHGFALSNEGFEFTKAYLQPVLSRGNNSQ